MNFHVLFWAKAAQVLSRLEACQEILCNFDARFSRSGLASFVGAATPSPARSRSRPCAASTASFRNVFVSSAGGPLLGGRLLLGSRPLLWLPAGGGTTSLAGPAATSSSCLATGRHCRICREGLGHGAEPLVVAVRGRLLLLRLFLRLPAFGLLGIHTSWWFLLLLLLDGLDLLRKAVRHLEVRLHVASRRCCHTFKCIWARTVKQIRRVKSNTGNDGVFLGELPVVVVQLEDADWNTGCGVLGGEDSIHATSLDDLGRVECLLEVLLKQRTRPKEPPDLPHQEPTLTNHGCGLLQETRCDTLLFTQRVGPPLAKRPSVTNPPSMVVVVGQALAGDLLLLFSFFAPPCP